MKEPPSDKAHDLRRKAEKRLTSEPAESLALSLADSRGMIHELRVHQIELEMQNEELRNAQARIEESHARYSDLYDFAPIGYFTLNNQGLIVEANLTGALQLGVERGRLINTPFLIYVALQDRPRFLSFSTSLFATQRQQNCEIKLAPKVGDEFFAFLDGIFVQGSANGFCRISISDISEHKRAEEALQHAHDSLEQLVVEKTAQLVAANKELKREIKKHRKTHEKLLRSEELYRQTAENLRGIIWIAEGELNEILYVSPAYEKIWGRTCESLYADSKSWVDAVHPEDTQEVAYILREIGTKELDKEYRIVHPDGSIRWVWSRSFPIRDESGNVYRVAGIAEDITARKLTEEAIRESEQRLRFLSSRLLTAQEDERKRIARELHDSIGSSLGAVNFGLQKAFQEIKLGVDTTESGRTLIETIQNAMDEVRRIMMDLRPSILDDIGLVATIGWFCRQFQAIYSNIHIEKEIVVGEEYIANPLKIVIFRILQEALNNIAKYSKADLVSLSFVKSDSSIELTIEDNGTGFDLNSVLSRENHERGLGLTGMRERTELSGGTFDLASTPGEGTRIIARWPLEPFI